MLMLIHDILIKEAGKMNGGEVIPIGSNYGISQRIDTLGLGLLLDLRIRRPILLLL